MDVVAGGNNSRHHCSARGTLIIIRGSGESLEGREHDMVGVFVGRASLNIWKLL